MNCIGIHNKVGEEDQVQGVQLQDKILEEAPEIETESESSFQDIRTDLFSYSNFAHAISGATGSVMAMTAFFPFDTVRTRLQVDDKRKAKMTMETMKELCEEEGVWTLYRGLVPVISSLYCSNFVYFYTFNGLKSISQSANIRPNFSLDLLIGYVSGVTNAFLTTPLWVANTRLKLQGIKSYADGAKNDHKDKTHCNGLIGTLYKIASEEGILSLWSGVRASLLLAGNPAIHFMVYETIKRFWIKVKNSKRLRSFEYFVFAGLAKTVATVLTYPLQLAQCRLRAGKGREVTNEKNALEVILSIYRQQGIMGLYKGLEAKLFQTVLTSSLMFLVYEKLVKFILKILKANGRIKS